MVGLAALWPPGAGPTLVSLTRGGLLRVHSRPAEDGSWTELASFSTGPSSSPRNVTAECLALTIAPAGTTGGRLVAAVGFHGREVVLYDVLDQKQIWRAKGGKPHPQTGLMDPAWTSAIAFLPPTSEEEGEKEKVKKTSTPDSLSFRFRFVTGTASHKLQLYDTQHGQRPYKQVVWGDARVTAVVVTHDGSACWAGNGRGHLSRWTFARTAEGTAAQGTRAGGSGSGGGGLGSGRGAGKVDQDAVQGILKGVSGSIRCLALHPEEPLLASVGLDRFLRVHHVTSLKPKMKMYLRNQMTSVVWAGATAEEVEEAKQALAKKEAATAI